MPFEIPIQGLDLCEEAHMEKSHEVLLPLETIGSVALKDTGGFINPHVSNHYPLQCAPVTQDGRKT